METGTIDERLLRVIRRVLEQTDSGDIVMDVDLRNVGLDSVRIISLLLELESEFGLTFPDEMLIADTFRTPSSLMAAVVSLQDSTVRPPAT